jgi:hypothetical protein
MAPGLLDDAAKSASFANHPSEQPEWNSEGLNSFQGHGGVVNENVLSKERSAGEKDYVPAIILEKVCPFNQNSALRCLMTIEAGRT